MRIGTPHKFALFAVLAMLGVVASPAQQVRYFPDFSSTAFLQLNGAHQAFYNNQYVLRLTNGIATGGAITTSSSTVWFQLQQPVAAGFTTYFRFQIHNAAFCCAPGDGLAFVIQNASKTDPTYGATGAGLTAKGVANGGIGYTGIPNSLAIEFDTSANAWDPTVNGNNHVAVQGCGTNTNGPVHTAGTYTIYHNNNVTSCLVGSGLNNSGTLPHLGVTCGQSSCADGSPHDVVIEYAPVANVWTLKLYVDPQFIAGTHTPVPTAVPAINIPYNIDNTQNPSTGLALGLDANQQKTLAWVGFSGSQTFQPQQQDILAWEFTPHTPTQVTQTILPGCDPHDPTCQPTTFTFGDHVDKVTYYPGYTNPNGIQMTVVATPISRSQFYQTRLKDTPFSNEQCVVYQGTGGNCIVYSVTCSDSNGNQVACPVSQGQCVNIGDPGCITFNTSYYTTDGVTPNDADYLKSDPIGTNNWVSIFESFDANGFDPRTTGTGSTPSDFVATFKVGAQNRVGSASVAAAPLTTKK